MAIEIERKFLVKPGSWKNSSNKTLYRQGYISAADGKVVRVRIAGEQAFLTIKGPRSGISAAEWEYPIPVQDAEEMLSQLCVAPLIEKYRYRIEHEGHSWEVDEFLGDNAPLVIAEIELKREDEYFEKPDWVAQEVSADKRYTNASLATYPYTLWRRT